MATVRIWAAVSTSAPLQVRSGSVTPLSETSSQLHHDLEPRTESSAGQDNFFAEIPHVCEPTSEDSAGPSSRRTIAFSTPQGLSISVDP